MQLLDQTRSACAHNRDMNPSPQELIKKGLEPLLAAPQKMRGIVTPQTAQSESAPKCTVQTVNAAILSAPKNHPTNRSRYIPAAVKREVTVRTQGRCEFRHPNGALCDSNHAIELHHVHAFSKGGKNTAQNLRLYCRTHNALEGVNEFGRHHHHRHHQPNIKAK